MLWPYVLLVLSVWICRLHFLALYLASANAYVLRVIGQVSHYFGNPRLDKPLEIYVTLLELDLATRANRK